MAEPRGPSACVLQRSGDDVFVTGDLAAGLPVVGGGIEIAAEGTGPRREIRVLG